jgi:CHAT domain-containing protein
MSNTDSEIQQILLELSSPLAAKDTNLAMELYRRALYLTPRKSFPGLWAQLQYDLGKSLAELPSADSVRNLEMAVRALELALEVFTELDHPSTSEVHVNLGIIQYNLAGAYLDRTHEDRAENLEHAIKWYQSSLKVRTRETRPVEWALTQMYLGQAFSRRLIGDLSENLESAIWHSRQALQKLCLEAHPRDWAATQITLGNALKDRIVGDGECNKESAITCYEAAFEIPPQGGIAPERMGAQMNLAIVYAERRKGDRTQNQLRARELYEAALEGFTFEDFPIDWAKTQMNLANLLRDMITGDAEANRTLALECYRNALTIRTAEMFPAEHVLTQNNLSYLLFRMERWPDAVIALRSALGTHGLLYRAAISGEARSASLRPVRNMSARLAYAQAKNGSPSDLREAVVALELGRSRFMAETLMLEGALLDGVPDEDKQCFREARESLQRLRAKARLQEQRPDRSAFLQISQELRQASGLLEDSIKRIQVYLPDFLSDIGFAQIRRLASSNPLVYIVATDSGGLALIVDGSEEVRANWLPELTDAALNEQIRRYSDAYLRQHNEHASWRQILNETLAWLWTAVMGPVVELLSGVDEVVLIPGGWLALLPLHAARVEDLTAPTGWKYALDLIRFRCAPSARSLISTLKSKMADRCNSILAVDQPLPVNGAQLQNSAHEVAEATSHFDRAVVLQHHDATRKAALELLPSHQVLHFSCHGHANLSKPLEGGLVMANNEMLTLRDFLDSQLPDTRLAVLSACATGMVGAELPDEVLGLPTGSLQAGVHGFVASLWSVSDASTMMLMCRFYGLWRDDEPSPATALIEAQRWLRNTTNEEKLHFFKQGLLEFSATRMAGDTADALFKAISLSDSNSKDFSDPFHWAAFTYTGI